MSGMKPNTIKRMNEKPVLNRPIAAVVAFLAVGGFSPLGMGALDFLGVKAPLSDWILSAAMFLMMLGVYHLLRRSFVRGARRDCARGE